ncbi:MAG: hypothetical protein GY723_04460 [bacterium]|nr:hypothetical protein [bacterium]MCP5067345.1 hypothetical protein [bacterium]
MISTDVITSNSSSNITGSSERPELGQEDFLAMLIAQLENQDPLEPQDGTEFTAQLAQFSSLEQLLGMREAIDELASVQVQAQTLGAVGLIGKTVQVQASQFEIDPNASELPKLAFELSEPADVRSVELFNEDGMLAARNDDLGLQNAGITELDWTDFSEQPGAGLYTIRINQIEGAQARSLVESRVTGTAIQNGVLFLGRAEANLADVREVRE